MVFAAKKELTDEVQTSSFADDLRTSLKQVLNNDFFTALEQTKISKQGYQSFIQEKYAAVGYFIPLLESAERHAKSVSTELANVFTQNRYDELGHFAGADHEAYAHDTWRKRSLAALDITLDPSREPKLASTKEHNEIMAELSISADAFEVFGCLLFLELFVVYEMKHLVQAFERDMPDLFPVGGYSYDKFPFNTHEYWYGHALHDTWHFRQIEEKLKILLEQGFSEERHISLRSGISKTAEAKNKLYSSPLLDLMRGLDVSNDALLH